MISLVSTPSASNQIKVLPTLENKTSHSWDMSTSLTLHRYSTKIEFQVSLSSRDSNRASLATPWISPQTLAHSCKAYIDTKKEKSALTSFSAKLLRPTSSNFGSGIIPRTATLATVPNAGMHARLMNAVACRDSVRVGSRSGDEILGRKPCAKIPGLSQKKYERITGTVTREQTAEQPMVNPTI